MNTKILSILMMLVIAAHVVSTSAVIASEKKRLQSQSASASTDDVVIDANTQFEDIESPMRVTMAWNIIDYIKDAGARQGARQALQTHGLENYLDKTKANNSEDADFLQLKDQLAFKWFEQNKESSI